MEAELGVEPRSKGYEPNILPLKYPANILNNELDFFNIHQNNVQKLFGGWHGGIRTPNPSINQSTLNLIRVLLRQWNALPLCYTPPNNSLNLLELLYQIFYTL